MKMMQKRKLLNKDTMEWSSPVSFFIPNSEQEIKAVIANPDNTNVRVCGSCEISNATKTDGCVISCQRLCDILKTDVNTKCVVVEPGVTLGVLQTHLQKHKLSLPIYPFVCQQTIIEALTQNEHGSGSNFFTIIHYIQEIKYIDGRGNSRQLNKDTAMSKLFSICRAAGQEGIVTELTLQCRSKTDLSLVSYGLKLTDLLQGLVVHSDSSPHFFFHWYPPGDRAIVHHTKVLLPGKTVKSSWIWNNPLLSCVIRAFQRFSTWLPLLYPLASRMAYCVYSRRRYAVKPRENPWLRGFNTGCRKTEWTFPRSHTALVLHELQSWTTSRYHHTYMAHPVTVSFYNTGELSGQQVMCSLTIPHRFGDDPLVAACEKIITTEI